MSTQTQRRAPWFAPFVLLVAGGGVALAYAASSRSGWPDDIRSPLVAGSCLLSAIVILLRCRHKGAWRSAPSLGLGMAAIAALSATLLVTRATGSEPPGLGLYEGGFLAAGVLFLIAVAIEFREHVAREDRREIVADVAPQRLIRVTEAVVASTPAFRFAKAFSGLEVIERQGDVIAWDGDEPVRAPYDNCVLIMPVPNNVKTGLTAQQSAVPSPNNDSRAGSGAPVPRRRSRATIPTPTITTTAAARKPIRSEA